MQTDRELPLAYLLLRASRWFDAALRDRLADRGWPRLSAAQSLVFAFLAPEGTPPATLARRLGATRQATQELVGGLVAHGLIEVADDPARRRGRLVRLTARGEALAADAGEVLAQLEDSLPAGHARTLRDLLAGVGAGPARDPQAGVGAGPA